MTRQSRVRRRLNSGSALLILLLLGDLLFPNSTAAQNSYPSELVLTNASSVLSLTGEEAAQRIPIRVKGVVTAAEPTWRGKFFIQDDTAGVFVDYQTASNQPSPGDVLEVTGVSQPGAFAPIIAWPSFKKMGTAELPEARVVSIDQLMSGIEDGQRVEISGIVRAVGPMSRNIDMELASGGYRFHVFPKAPAGIDPQTFIGARVRVRGTAAAVFNATLRQLMSMIMFIPQPNDFIVEELEPVNPFSEPLIPLNSVAQYRRDNSVGRRVHVKGVVTLQRPGQDVFLEDVHGGLHVKSSQLETFAVGDVVEAVGFPAFEHFLPVLEDAVFQKTSETRSPAAPRKATIEEIQRGLHHADLIKLQGKLVDRIVRRGRWRANHPPWTRTVLMMQAKDLVFSAEIETDEPTPNLALIPVGSILEVTGVCFTESDRDKKLQSLQVLLPEPGSVRVLKKPSWWTPQRLLIGLAALFGFLVIAVSWTVMVSKKNSRLNVLIKEKEIAREELQQAHDHLEERVRERTEQLKFQITARKESELQFKAVLSERTRLAQELHDTLEQTLTGIALQLDTAAKLSETNTDNAHRHVELARNLVAQSQVEVRRSVWDLRSRALEQFDLPNALLASSKQLSDGTNVRFEVSAKGRVRPLPETIEENLLRIAQEAMTNVIKHSGASRVDIELDYGPRNVGLKIRDNGCGFQTNACAGPADGHFGLLGISERAKRLRGEARIISAAGEGTTIQVQIPIEPEISSALAEMTIHHES